MALRRAFVNLPGCVYHYRGAPPKASSAAQKAAEANAPCCTAKCRADQLMPFAPPGAKMLRGGLMHPGARGHAHASR